MDDLKNIPLEIIYVSLAALGGVARYLQKYLDEGKFGWQHLIVHIVISAFSGFMFYQFAENVLHISPSMVPVLAGMGGWMGVESLKVVEALVKKLFKKDGNS